MATRQSFWMGLLAALVAAGAHASNDGEFRLGALASYASWSIGHNNWREFEPDGVSTAIVGQYVVRFDVGRFRGFGGFEVVPGLGSDAKAGKRIATEFHESPDTLPDYYTGASASKVADAACLIGFDGGGVTVFASAGVSYATGRIYYIECDPCFWFPIGYGPSQAKVTGQTAKRSLRGYRYGIGVERRLGDSLVVQMRASRTDYRKVTYLGSSRHYWKLTEFEGTLLYRF